MKTPNLVMLRGRVTIPGDIHSWEVPAMRYRLIYYPPLALTPEPYTFQTRDAFQTYAAAQGWQQIGLHYSQRTHAALQGQPIYADVAGPTWAGDAVQYEDKTTSNHKDIK